MRAYCNSNSNSNNRNRSKKTSSQQKMNGHYPDTELQLASSEEIWVGYLLLSSTDIWFKGYSLKRGYNTNHDNNDNDNERSEASYQKHYWPLESIKQHAIDLGMSSVELVFKDGDSAKVRLTLPSKRDAIRLEAELVAEQLKFMEDQEEESDEDEEEKNSQNNLSKLNKAQAQEDPVLQTIFDAQQFDKNTTDTNHCAKLDSDAYCVSSEKSALRAKQRRFSRNIYPSVLKDTELCIREPTALVQLDQDGTGSDLINSRAGNSNKDPVPAICNTSQENSCSNEAPASVKESSAYKRPCDDKPDPVVPKATTPGSQPVSSLTNSNNDTSNGKERLSVIVQPTSYSQLYERKHSEASDDTATRNVELDTRDHERDEIGALSVDTPRDSTTLRKGFPAEKFRSSTNSSSCTKSVTFVRNSRQAGFIETRKEEEKMEAEDANTEHQYHFSSSIGYHFDQQPNVPPENLVEATVVEETADVRPSYLAAAVKVQEPGICRKYLYTFVGGGCLLLGLAVALVTYFVASGNNANDSMELPPISTEERCRIMYDYVKDIVQDPNKLDHANTPYFKALDWICKTDPMQIDPRLVEQEEDDDVSLHLELKQRFLMALFYYGMTTGENNRWLYCRPPQTGENDACVHQLVESYAIEGVYYPQIMSEPSFRWLSKNSVCRWAGLHCSNQGTISTMMLGTFSIRLIESDLLRDQAFLTFCSYPFFPIFFSCFFFCKAGYNLTGTLPAELGYLNDLVVLDLHQNNIMGSLPATFGSLARKGVLRTLRLDQNKISGPFPQEWCGFNKTSMEELILANNVLTGTLPACIAEMTALEDVSVMHNTMTGTIPGELGNLMNLQTIHLAGNKFHGFFPSSLCDLQEHWLVEEASSDCLNNKSESYVACSCCTKCCIDEEETCVVSSNP